MADGSNVDRRRRRSIEEGAEIVRPGTDGAELVEELKPTPDAHLQPDRLLDGEFRELGSNEWALYKPRWSAFYSTGLADFLTDRGPNTVVVCGCNFPNCPRTTIYDASQREFRIVFVTDATSGTYDRGLEELAHIDVATMDAGATVEWLAQERPADS